MQAFLNKITYGNRTYCFVPIDIAIRFSDLIDFSFLLPLKKSNPVEIHYQEEDVPGVLKRYQEKGLKNLLFLEDDYNKFLEQIKQHAQAHFKQNFETEDAVEFLEGTYQFIANSMNQFGVNEKNMEAALTLNRTIILGIKNKKHFWTDLKNLQRRCSEQFLRNLYTSILLYQMISYFPWQNKNLQENVMLAVLLCDIRLDPRFQSEVLRFERGELKYVSDTVKKHPLELWSIVSQYPGLNVTEIKDIIEQVHEKPDGSGFPNGLKAEQLSLLSSLHITARMFVSKVFEHQFKHELKEEILSDLTQKLNQKNFFGASLDILKHVLNVDSDFNQ